LKVIVWDFDSLYFQRITKLFFNQSFNKHISKPQNTSKLKWVLQVILYDLSHEKIYPFVLSF